MCFKPFAYFFWVALFPLEKCRESLKGFFLVDIDERGCR